MYMVASHARELAEAIIDAAERAEYQIASIAVISVGEFFIATSAYVDEDECVVVVMPPHWFMDHYEQEIPMLTMIANSNIKI